MTIPNLKKVITGELAHAAVIIVFIFSTMSLLPMHEKALKAIGLNMTDIVIYNVVKNITPIFFGGLLAGPALVKRWHTHTGVNWIKMLTQGTVSFILIIPTISHVLKMVLSVCNLEINIPYLASYSIWRTYPDSILLFNLAAIWFGKVLVDSIKGKPRTFHE